MCVNINDCKIIWYCRILDVARCLIFPQITYILFQYLTKKLKSIIRLNCCPRQWYWTFFQTLFDTLLLYPHWIYLSLCELSDFFNAKKLSKLRFLLHFQHITGFLLLKVIDNITHISNISSGTFINVWYLSVNISVMKYQTIGF